MVKIRLAKSSDLAALEKMMYDLHDEHHLACPQHFKVAKEAMEEKRIADYLESPEGLVFIAELNDQCIGFVSGHFADLVSSVSRNVFMGSIDEFYVLPQYRGQGIGSQLLKRIEKEFDDYGVQQMFVEVWDFNQSAIRLYQNLGFAHHIHWLRKGIR
ncbi:GNAT family N-acetyltransferase [Vibrio mangrovi]|uniref:Acetyltransferase YpeA n=1 Tax=Vibrio mangrovi TaxID=474394 RepID=A0A1Y6IN89_9VIBR|nr:GNAT family N-acetyltransferase [Vibrio mangrovi]MDW6004095.1 GNAT family N-acetyltransferase [Vibrio mangrovi]SMR99107.1 Acetyltransferase YpeA [Vibrio mangrovi]